MVAALVRGVRAAGRSAQPRPRLAADSGATARSAQPGPGPATDSGSTGRGGQPGSDLATDSGRTSLSAEPDPTLPPILVPPDAAPLATPVAAAGSPPLPVAVPGAAPIPLYRQEVPVWSVLPSANAQLALTALGTFHDRQGDQRLLTETGAFGAGWGRVYGKDLDQTWAGTVTPRLDGSLNGFQVGNDLFGSQTAGGQTQRTGFFVGHSRLQGDVDGFNQGFEGKRAGKVELEGDSVGLYWTLTDPENWYVDTVAMYTWLDGDSHSDRGLKIDNKGHAVTLSAEAGYPLRSRTNGCSNPRHKSSINRFHSTARTTAFQR